MQAQLELPISSSSLRPEVATPIAPGALSPMRLKWKATFIEQVAPKEAAVLRRAQSEALLGASGCAAFSLERAYVDTLEAEVDRLLALPRHLAEKPPRPSKRASLDVDVLSIISLETRCPSPARYVNGVMSSPGGVNVFVSESTTAFGSESPSTSTLALGGSFRGDSPAAPPGRFGSEPPRALAPGQSRPPAAPARVGARPFGSDPPAPPSRASPHGLSLQSVGSLGHPQLCNRPCIQFSRGQCEAGAACRFCHLVHGGRGGRTPHLDKRHREQLLRLPFAQRAAVALPIMVRQVAKLGIQADAEGLLRAMEAVASPAPWDVRTRREGASLISALGALSFHSLLTVIGKAPDTPEWLRKSALEEHIEHIRAAEKMRSRQGW